jgi:type IX secretion system PorP/SprF family membrane protein
MCNKKLIILFICLIFNKMNGQDYKFSQFYNSPLTLNPALTGKINSLYRVVANYRMQYNPVITPSPYMTMSASGDVGLLRDKLNEDILGVGLVFVTDNQASGLLKSNYAYISAAYHKGIGYEKKHYISAGFQFGIMQRKLDVNNLVFNSQYQQFVGFDKGIPSGENFERASFVKPNLNIGLFWSSSFTDNMSAYAGMSVHNTLKPTDNFLATDSERDKRIAAHGGITYIVGKKIIINPNMIFQTQAKAIDFIAGTNVNINLSGKRNPFETNAFAGIWYDINKAIIATAGVQHKGFQVGVSYDATMGGINDAVNSFGAIELSLMYVSAPLSKDKKYPLMSCPKF